MLRTSSAWVLFRGSQRGSWQLNGQRAFTNSQTALDALGPSSSKSPTTHDVSRDSSTAPRPGVVETNERQPLTPQRSPTTVALVKGLAWLMGYKSKTSTAIRETREAYALCTKREVEEANFIQHRCRLAPTYQTWFQIANLHVWLVRTRYRALPATHGKIYEQEIINHLFLDVEDRMRAALAHKAPERIIKGYMKEMRDQWAGATFSFDLGLVGSDTELSGAIWRNIFASRGLDGKGEAIGLPGKISEPRGVEGDNIADPDVGESSSIGTLNDSALTDLPFHLYVFTAYVRRELGRLESLSDEQVLAGHIGPFGSMESHALVAEQDFVMEKEERKLLGLDEDIPPRISNPKMKRRVANA